MSYGTGARSDFTARQAKSPRQNISRNALAATALANVVLAWTLHATVFVRDIGPAAISANFQPVTADSSVEGMTFTARFDALGAGPEGISVVRKSAAIAPKASEAIRKTYMALLDVTYSLGPPPGSFSTSMPRGPDRELTMSPEQSAAEDVAPAAPSRAPRGGDSVPLRSPRPSTLPSTPHRERENAERA